MSSLELCFAKEMSTVSAASQMDRQPSRAAPLCRNIRNDQHAYSFSCNRNIPSTSGRDDVDQKVVAVYKGVGLIMKRFTTGRVPKAFKIIPNLQNWEEVCTATFASSFILLNGPFLGREGLIVSSRAILLGKDYVLSLYPRGLGETTVSLTSEALRDSLPSFCTSVPVNALKRNKINSDMSA